MPSWVYILECADGSYYTGMSANLEGRLNQHAEGAVRYTAKRRPIKFLWSQDFAHIDDAFTAEKQIKGWSRAKKEALMRGDWETVRKLARGRNRET